MIRWTGMPEGSNRQEFLEAVFQEHEATATGEAAVAALRATISRLAAQLVIPPLTDEQAEALSQPADSELDGIGRSLEPHLFGGRAVTERRRPRVAAGTLVGTVWRGMPWKLGKLYLGQRNGRAYFGHSRPALIFDVAIEDVVQCEGIRGAEMPIELSAELQEFAHNIWPMDIDARRHASLDLAQGVALTEIIDRARVLPPLPRSSVTPPADHRRLLAFTRA